MLNYNKLVSFFLNSLLNGPTKSRAVDNVDTMSGISSNLTYYSGIKIKKSLA